MVSADAGGTIPVQILGDALAAEREGTFGRTSGECWFDAATKRDCDAGNYEGSGTLKLTGRWRDKNPWRRELVERCP